MANKIEPTEFKYVEKIVNHRGDVYFRSQIKRCDNGIKKSTSKTYDTIREAAIAVDKYLIKQGKEPVNILVRK